MERIRQVVASVTGVLVIAGSVALSAQQPEQPPSSQQQEQREDQGQQERGELLRVDPTAMTFAIRTAAGDEKEFSYDQQTDVSGSEQGAQGLAAMTGQQVTVSYEEGSDQQGATPTATKIEVDDAESGRTRPSEDEPDRDR